MALAVATIPAGDTYQIFGDFRPGLVEVSFNELVDTVAGQSIFVLGNIPALGNSNPNAALSLGASADTADDPSWTATVNVPAGTTFLYLPFRVNQDYTVTYLSLDWISELSFHLSHDPR